MKLVSTMDYLFQIGSCNVLKLRVDKVCECSHFNQSFFKRNSIRYGSDKTNNEFALVPTIKAWCHVITSFAVVLLY